MGDGGGSPNSIIHSVDEQAPPTPQAASPAKKANGKPMRGGASALSVTSLKRIFSPTYDRKSPSPRANASSTGDADGAPAPRKKNMFRFFTACFVPSDVSVPQLEPHHFLQQIRDCEPTYVPDSPLLPPPAEAVETRTCLVLDLDETLVHSSFTPIPDPDFEIPLEMQGETHMVYVKKRPGVDNFLEKVSQWYEVIVFTASLALYANPVMDLLDPKRLVHGRLYREHCVLTSGCYVKDISKLGRDLKKTLIIDNSPLSYALQPENAIPITSFITDDNDRELEKTLALLQDAKGKTDVRSLYS